MEDQKLDNVNDSQERYTPSGFHFFNSFQEMNEYDIQQMATLSPMECLLRLRQNINLAYGMHGYIPEQTPTTRNIQIISYSE